MDIDSIIKALTKDALYTYEFDVTTGIVEKDHTGETTYDVTYRRRNDSDHCHDLSPVLPWQTRPWKAKPQKPSS